MTAAQIRKVVLAAGGTGGHMFPAEALARELRARGVEAVLVTDGRGSGFAGDLADVETHRISAGGIAGGGLVKRVGGLFQLARGLFQARALMRRIDPDAVVGFGAYAAAPTVLAGALSGRRVVLHEQNAVAGRANRWLAGRAARIATGFAEVRGFKAEDRAKTRHTGNPVRPAIQALAAEPYRAPSPGSPIHLLVVGGSQGAKIFNSVVPAAVARLPEATRARVQVVQQVPGGTPDTVEAAYRDCGVAAELARFFDDMPARLAQAHLVISRAGASTVTELACAGRPAILVPYPHATDDHQTANARALADIEAGWLLPETALAPEALAERLESLLEAPSRLEAAAERARTAAPGDAASRLADLVCGRAGDNGGALPDETGAKSGAKTEAKTGGEPPKEAAA